LSAIQKLETLDQIK